MCKAATRVSPQHQQSKEVWAPPQQTIHQKHGYRKPRQGEAYFGLAQWPSEADALRRIKGLDHITLPLPSLGVGRDNMGHPFLHQLSNMYQCAALSWDE